MTRSVLWFLAGALAALAVLYIVLRSHHGGRILLAAVPSHRVGGLRGGGPGPGSGIRVVGGSVTVQLSQKQKLTFSESSSTKLSVQTADSSSFMITNVSGSSGTTNVTCPSPAPSTDCALPPGKWTIDELVADSGRGVTIGGDGKTSGTVTFVPKMSGDSFGPGFLWLGLLFNYRYSNDNNPDCSDPDQCEMVKQFVITAGTFKLTLNCADDAAGLCDVDIGHQ